MSSDLCTPQRNMHVVGHTRCHPPPCCDTEPPIRKKKSRRVFKERLRGLGYKCSTKFYEAAARHSGIPGWRGLMRAPPCTAFFPSLYRLTGCTAGKWISYKSKNEQLAH